MFRAEWLVMMRDIHLRWWRVATAFVLLVAVALLLMPQAQHDHAFLFFVALAPVLWLFSIVVAEEQCAIRNESAPRLVSLFQIPSLSHLPPPGTLA